MRRTQVFSRSVFVVALIAVLLLSSFSFVGAQEPKVLYSAFLPGDVTIDPSLGTDVNSITIINEIFPGLTMLHEETVEVIPGIAESWDVSEDGTTYTFHLRQDVSWVRYDAEAGEVVQVTDESGNVRMVNAHDVVYGYTRTLTPETGGDYASVLAPWVVNGIEHLAGEDVELGISAVDDFTFQVTSPVATGFLPMIYYFWMARPQPAWVIEEFGDSWTEAANINSYGPFALKEWEHDATITIVRNPFWPGTENSPVPTLDEVNWVWLDLSAQLQAYEAGELDYLTSVPLPDLDRLRAEIPDQLHIGPDTCTYYYGFNNEKPPFDNLHMRRAFSLAIDRDVIVQILNAGQKPAGFFTRPEFAASPTQEEYPELAMYSDAEEAQAELQMYFDETGTTLEDLPPIQLMYNTSELHATLAQAIQQMWMETLGIEVQISSQDFGVYLEMLGEDAPHIYRLAWCYDYPDPHNWLYDVWRSDSGHNDSNYNNPEYDALVDEAMTLTDNAARKELYAQAEYLLVNQDAGIAPIYYYVTQELTKPYITRTFGNTGHQVFEKWDLNR
jgi:oligopeptide transport system substrate-binding protein